MFCPSSTVFEETDCKEVREDVRGEVSAVLGPFLKAKIDRAERALMDAAGNYGAVLGGGWKRDEVDVVLARVARGGCRGKGEGKLIAENVLSFLDGLWGSKRLRAFIIFLFHVFLCC